MPINNKKVSRVRFSEAGQRKVAKVKKMDSTETWFR